MNFPMLRSNNQTAEQQPLQESHVEQMLKRTHTLGSLIAEDPYPDSRTSETRDAESDECGSDNGSFPGSSGKSNPQIHSHVDVAEDEGWIIIPYSTASCLASLFTAFNYVYVFKVIIYIVLSGSLAWSIHVKISILLLNSIKI